MPGSKRTASQAAGASAQTEFNFKKLKRATDDGAASSSASARPAQKSKPTTTRVTQAVYQSGDRAGEPVENSFLFVFNPRKGKNDVAIDAVKAHAYPGDDVSKFKRDLDGFCVKVHNPKQGQRMQSSLREIDSALSQTLDVGELTAPEVTIVTVKNVDLPETRANEAQTGVTALMLDGYTYPLYKKLRPAGYDFVRDVHGLERVNRWMRVVGADDNADKLRDEVSALLTDEGWSVKTEWADASKWTDDDEDE